ncbi:MAG: hypothetical protein V7K40_02790 [Nostoc sp.]|uniref:hypothetical protein n=1 Tax=Nostoc sp. TaxID=1180 RepID=UPI002FF5FCF3
MIFENRKIKIPDFLEKSGISLFINKPFAKVKKSGMSFYSRSVTAGYGTEGATGTIREYHLNPVVVGRGVCIQMNPGLPTVEATICLWKDNALYKEVTDLLLEGYSSRKTCLVSWTTYREGLAAIDYVTCYNG